MKGCQRVLRGARGVLLALVFVEVLLRIGVFLVTVLTRTSRSTAAGGAEGTIRIVCLGDSHTFGVGASEGSSSYPSQLEQRLARCWDKPVRVINLGVPGQNSSQVTKSVEQVMTRQRPSLLLVLVGVNNQWNFVDVNLLEPSIAQRV
ncbi:MAG: hypothetical protein HYZ73_09415, partial [Elusimicrobia bacterium]|nr:hypothetical protein [Elusimicrobiota bacterium]